MELDSARNAKFDVFRKAFSYTEVASSLSADDNRPTYVAGEELWAAKVPGKVRDDQLISVGIGRRATDGGRSNDKGNFQLVVYCQKKSLIDHPIVESIRFEAKGEVRVVYTGMFRRHESARVRPIHLGASIGHFRVTAGTLGCFVHHAKAGVCMLSNNHVFAATNAGNFGDVILQPAKKDSGRRPGDVVGALHRSIPIQFEIGAINRVDCAIATIEPGTEILASEFGPVIGSGLKPLIKDVNDDLFVTDEVYKVGRSTGLTRGRVVAVEHDNLWVNYSSAEQTRLARFDGQINIANGASGAFSKPGDSGSLIIDAQGRPSALLFAGSAKTGITSANPIRAVLDALECEIYI